MKCHPMRDQDIDAVVEISQLTQFGAAYDTADGLRLYRDAAFNRVHVATIKDEVVSYAKWYSNPADDASVIFVIAVHPSCWGRGLGGWLVWNLRMFTRTRVRAIAHPSDLSHAEFLTRCGFSIRGQTPRGILMQAERPTPDDIVAWKNKKNRNDFKAR